MESTVERLTDAMAGSYAVRTVSGTLYAVRLGPRRDIVRLAKDLSPSLGYEHVPAAMFRGDGDTIERFQNVRMEVGQCGLMWLDVRQDGVPTLRTTTELLSITHPNTKPAGT